MQYIDQAYLEGLLPLQKIIELCDDAGSGEMDSFAVAALDSANLLAVQEVHLYCAGHYTLPFDPVPDGVMSLTAQLTVIYLYHRRMPDAVPDSIAAKHKAVQEQLERINARTFSLGVDEADDAVAAAQGPQVTETTQRFGQGFMGELLDT